jgi:glycopeptide antibiotics resistance protein
MKHLELNLKPANRETTIVIILAVYLIYLFTFTLISFEFSLDTSLSLSRMYYGDLETFFTNTSYFVWDIIINIPLFIPFGFLFFALLKVLEKKWTTKIILTTFSGFILSFIIEFCQLFLPRSPSLADIFANTVGAITGALIATFYYAQLTRLVQRGWSNIQRSKSLSTIIIIYGALLFIFSNFPILHSDFSNWDPSFTFQLGNEATLNRPWLGKIYLVAIYRRALNPEEVTTNFKAGPFRDASKSSARDNLVAFYNFNEGTGNTVHDTSSFDLPLDLTIYDTSRTKWLTPNGIEFLEDTIIKSQKPAEKLFYHLYSNNSLTIEAWIAPANITQGGPARILSLSRDPSFRNFTLGQEGKNIHFRLRTPISGLNGTKVHLQTKDDFLTMEIQHLVATYRNGVEKLYVNSIEYETTLLDASNNLLNLLGAGLGGKWAYCFLFLFPVGFLSYTILLKNPGSTVKAILFSAIIGFSPLVVIESFQVIKVPRPFDLSLLSLGLVVVFMSILMSSIINKNIHSA